jgi:hypothetical protein
LVVINNRSNPEQKIIINIPADKTQENDSRTIAYGFSPMESEDRSSFQFVENRTRTFTQRKRQGSSLKRAAKALQ